MREKDKERGGRRERQGIKGDKERGESSIYMAITDRSGTYSRCYAVCLV